MNDEKLKNIYAYNFNTIPKYIFKDMNGNWRNFENEIVSYTGPVDNPAINPIRYYEDVNTNAQVPLRLTLYEICFFYVLANAGFHKFMHDVGRDMFIYRTAYNLDDETEKVITELYQRVSNQDSYRKMIQDEIELPKQRFRQRIEREQAENKFLDNLPDVPYIPFEIEKIKRIYSIDTTKLPNDIETIFNRFVVSETVPFICTHKFYKVLKGFSYDIDLVPEENNVLIIYTKQSIIELEKTEKNEYFISFEIKTNEDDNPILDMICSNLSINIEDLSLEKERLNGVSWFPNQNLDTIIWKELVFNNDMVNKKLVIDERNLTNRKKKEFGRKTVRKVFFMYYLHSEDNRTTLSMREDETNGVRVKILNVTSREIANNILADLSTFLSLYNYMGKDIQNEYNKLLGEKIIEFKPPTETTKDVLDTALKNIAPDMFLPNYTRKCTHLPRIVADADAKHLEKDGFQVMAFPKEDDGRSMNYSCDKYDEHKYPGLRKNTLENKDKFPLLPCCYSQDHKKKKTSLLKEYYNTNKKLADFIDKSDVVEQQNIQYRFLISDKFVGFEQTGKCSEELTNFFSLFSDIPILRRGVHRTKYSFLECVLLETDFEGFKSKSSKERQDIVLTEMKKLIVDDNVTGICAQECWNTVDKKINEDRYLDPRLFIRLIEYVYGARIVLFRRDDFLYPNHIQGYLRWEQNYSRKVVFIYEHYGSEADQAVFPQCELIQFTKQIDRDNISNRIYIEYINSFRVANLSQTFSTRIIDDINNFYELVAQHVDFYGKTYGFLVKDKNTSEEYSILLKNTKIPPIYLPVKKDIIYSNEEKEIQISQYIFRICIEPVPSILKEYNDKKLQVALLFENAKKIYSKRIEDAEDNEWDWIRISKELPDYSRYFFSDKNYVIVPNEESKKRLIYTLELYRMRYRSKLALYKEFNKINIPFNSMDDFDVQENCVIADTDVSINWMSNFYTILPIDGTLFPVPFMCVIKNMIYKCVPVENIPTVWNSYTVLFPQVKKIFRVFKREHSLLEEHTILVIKNKLGLHKYYICEQIYSYIDFK